MDGLPWVSKADYPYLIETDPMAYRTHQSGPGIPGNAADPVSSSVEKEKKAAVPEEPLPDLSKGSSAKEIIRTALCVQHRNGRLYVFMPPLEKADHYFELISAVEKTAQNLKMPVTIEGYLPPFDPNLNVMKITPDPGVLEVNIHPAPTWEDLVKTTTDLYDIARLNRLGTENFCWTVDIPAPAGKPYRDRRPNPSRQPCPAASGSIEKSCRLL